MQSAAKEFETLTSWTGNPSTATSLHTPSTTTPTLPVTPTADKAVGVLAAKTTFFARPGTRPLSTSLALQTETERERKKERKKKRKKEIKKERNKEKKKQRKKEGRKKERRKQKKKKKSQNTQTRPKKHRKAWEPHAH
jgi:hypothetical protein